MKKRPLTPSDRAGRSRAKAVDAGAQRLEVILHGPAIAALDHLVRQQGSKRAAVEHALILAAKK